MIYNKIRNLLRERKATLKDLHNYMNVSKAGYNKMEIKDTMKVKDLIKIAEFLNVSPCYFFEDKPLKKETDIDKVFDALKELVKTKIK